jgi:hypothetical protein
MVQRFRVQRFRTAITLNVERGTLNLEGDKLNGIYRDPKPVQAL